MVCNILYHFYIVQKLHVLHNGIIGQNGSITNVIHVFLIFVHINIILKDVLVFISIHFKLNSSLTLLCLYIFIWISLSIFSWRSTVVLLVGWNPLWKFDTFCNIVILLGVGFLIMFWGIFAFILYLVWFLFYGSIMTGTISSVNFLTTIWFDW